IIMIYANISKNFLGEFHLLYKIYCTKELSTKLSRRLFGVDSSKEGQYPVISGGQKPAYYIEQFNREGETITIAGSGAYAGYVMYWNEPIFVSDAFSIKANEMKALPR
ncbi:MAG: hypothetical protein PHY55_03760, partial [Bacteroidales bacterium]|nr:hypothetical protein [Bacteroidales bacterium]